MNQHISKVLIFGLLSLHFVVTPIESKEEAAPFAARPVPDVPTSFGRPPTEPEITIPEIKEKINFDPPKATKPKAETYTVKRGDTLQKIAKRKYGDPRAAEKIFKANRGVLKNSRALKVGQKLILP